MIIKVPRWLAYKLTRLPKEYRITEWFEVIKETDNAYRLCWIRDEEREPIGWAAKKFVIEKKDDDSEEWSKIIETHNKWDSEKEKKQ